MIRGLKDAAESLGISTEAENAKNKCSNEKPNRYSAEDIPMMYRAQVRGRCSLMFAGKDKHSGTDKHSDTDKLSDRNKHLDQWKDEWISPDPEQPRCQKKEPPLGLDGAIYRIAVDFPFRLISNCGQDSIIRPILGKNGIPIISGSSVKGLFRRACRDSQIAKLKYCGDEQKLAPSSLGFRFHGAYPVGDWAGTHEVTVTRRGQSFKETRHRLLDVVHPQQKRQIGDSRKDQKATALASISLYQPRMIFEFSSSSEAVDWQEVEEIFWQAIALGLGGKTSTGYGVGGYNSSHPASTPPGNISLALKGKGVSPTLRSNEPEFRPNLFKASLRGHFQRLLAGVIGDAKAIDKQVDDWFGSSSGQGTVQLTWQSSQPAKYGKFGSTQTFKAEGKLYVNPLEDKDAQLMEQLLKFAFVMSGFGKSWRRASHELFHKTYKKFEIGCHWELADASKAWVELRSVEDLGNFLTEIHQAYKERFSDGSSAGQNWRETWHPDRLAVYAAVVTGSKAIELFHNDIYKKTPAVGGKNPGDDRPKYVSSVWHRMLPIEGGRFLEIVTVFQPNINDWTHETEGPQLASFRKALETCGLSFAWGNPNMPIWRNPNVPIKKPKRKLPDPKK